MSREAMKLALEALEAGEYYIDDLEAIVYGADDLGTHEDREKMQEAITALREALADQPAQQEPVIWAISYDGKTPYAIWPDGDGALLDLEIKRQGGTASKMPLYTSLPAQRTWVGLTDEERDAIIGATDLSGTYYYDDLYAVILLAEGKFKEKNT